MRRQDAGNPAMAKLKKTAGKTTSKSSAPRKQAAGKARTTPSLSTTGLKNPASGAAWASGAMLLP